MTELEAAWLAGLLEGEGCFTIFHRKDRPNTVTCAIHLEMTDQDVVRKAYDIAKVGTVILRPNTSGRKDQIERKPTWIWSVQNKAGVAAVCEIILPHMMERRSTKIEEVLSYCK